MLVGFVEFELVHLLHLFLFHPVNYLHSLFLLLLLLSLLPHFVELNQIVVDMLINIFKLNHLLLFRFFMFFYNLQKLLTFLTTPTLMTTHLLLLRRRFALYLLQLMINILHSPLFLINLLDLSLNLLQFSLKPLFMSLFQYSDAFEMVFLDIFVFHQFLFLLARLFIWNQLVPSQTSMFYLRTRSHLLFVFKLFFSILHQLKMRGSVRLLRESVEDLSLFKNIPRFSDAGWIFTLFPKS